MGGISIPSLLIILAIVVLLFGTKRLKNLGSDLGSAIKGFKNSVSDDNDKQVEDKSATQKDADFSSQSKEEVKKD